ncbi:MAG: FAD binding domain-containing protein [Byssovorax sp.]
MSLADLSRFEMTRERSLDGLCAVVSARHEKGLSTILYAGGTDWMVEQEMRAPLAEDPPLVVDIGRMSELRGIDLAGDLLRIGAATTYLELERSEVVQARAPMLVRMAKDVGAVQIQARGTLGGNLATASPAADGVAALAAYDATILVRSARGERRIAMADLQTGYKKSTRAADEIIVAVELALPPGGSPWYWRKVGARRAQAISKVALAGLAVVEGGRATRVGLGMVSVAPVTARMPATRALVLGKSLAEITGEAIDRAVSADVTPIDDVRSTGEYRLHVARALTRDWLRQLGAGV